MARDQKRNKRCELLAPAGSRDAFIAAVESGADAIYVGGTLFNARMNAKNLSDGDLAEAIAFAHKRRVRVYVTVNTLIKDSEMPEALAYCERLGGMGADGLIIQDLGIGKAVRDHFPEIPIHLSTQGSVYDLRGVRAAERLGYSRVILERQLSLEEIREVCRGTDTEIEVFCHGALCFCYSGQCQLSRYIGGRSANRGECAQPCRMEYRWTGAGGKRGSGFLLSPADSCMLGRVGELIDAGVASLKIEGRMKSPEYVSEVTSIYRKRIDEYYAAKEAEEKERMSDPAEAGSRSSQEDAGDIARLTQIYSRGFTDGFMSGKEDGGFMSGSTSKNRGVMVGKVRSVSGSAGRSGGRLIEAETFIEIAKGDSLEIRRRERGGERAVASCLVTYLDGRRIGDVKPYEGESVRPGDAIFRIASKAQTDRAALSYRNKDWDSGKYSRKTPLSLYITEDQKLKGYIRIESDDPEMNWRFGPFGPGADISGRVASAFAKTGGTPFDPEGTRIGGEICLAVPMSSLNEMRRTVFADIGEKLAGQAVRNETDGKERPETTDAAARGGSGRPEKPCLEVYFYDIEDFRKWKEGTGLDVIRECRDAGIVVRAVLPAVQMPDADFPEASGGICEGIVAVPYISANTLGKEERLIKERYGDLLALAGETGIYVGNLSAAELFRGTGVRMYADFGLNIYNEECLSAYGELGVEPGVMSLEATDKGCGAYPLMTTRHRFAEDVTEGGFTDRKGAHYRVLTPGWSDNSIIVPDSEPDWEGCLKASQEAFRDHEIRRVYVAGRRR